MSFVSEKVNPCSLTILENGERVKIEGIEKGGGFSESIN